MSKITYTVDDTFNRALGLSSGPSDLAQRRQALRTHGSHADRGLHAFPILSVVAPAVTQPDNTVEFPGDPMCIYHALGVSIRDAIASFSAEEGEARPFNDFVPAWPRYPKLEERLAPEDHTDAAIPQNSVFDPRVWNDSVEREYRSLLSLHEPRIVLVSSVSPAYRYAVELLGIAREVVPDAVLILGGRHVDDTTIEGGPNQEYDFRLSSPLWDMQRGDIDPIVDVIVAGDCRFSLSVLLQAIAMTMSVDNGPEKKFGTADRSRLVTRLRELSCLPRELHGHSTIIVVGDNEGSTLFPIRRPPASATAAPNPYMPFPIKAFFPIFGSHVKEGGRTGHLLTTTACPYACEFCSESRLVGSVSRRTSADVDWVVDAFSQLVSWGADAVFFDDSILLGGASRKVVSLCNRLKAIGGNMTQWGGQVTVSTVESWTHTADQDILSCMRSAGCTYLYCGLESLAPEIMEHVHKARFRRTELAWPERVREVLRHIKSAGIRCGSSILFGLDGETRETIDYTVDFVEALVKDELLYLVSPNLLTYHPGTEVTIRHDAEGRICLRNAKLGEFIRPPYAFFEEAFPGMVSKQLTEELIWHIHKETEERWGAARNIYPMVK
ncbi:MAG: B12-binding domain-containing radical SAM protein [Pseudomonadota bacterium]